jgi:hypothetical protein
MLSTTMGNFLESAKTRRAIWKVIIKIKKGRTEKKSRRRRMYGFLRKELDKRICSNQDLNNYSKSSNGEVQTHWKLDSNKMILSRSSHICYTYAEALYEFIKEMKSAS